jgi:GNAT superfamily N-acetyltransferase
MGTDISIRPVRRDEALAVARVHVQADRETYAPIFAAQFREVSLEESLARWETALTAGHSFLVATDAGAIVGLAHAGEAWMSALYLLASHRRRGIGARLLAALCAGVRARGVEEIGFTCVAANAPALAFYEAMGARQLGRTMIGDGADAWEEMVLALSTDERAAAFRRG